MALGWPRGASLERWPSFLFLIGDAPFASDFSSQQNGLFKPSVSFLGSPSAYLMAGYSNADTVTRWFCSFVCCGDGCFFFFISSLFKTLFRLMNRIFVWSFKSQE